MNSFSLVLNKSLENKVYNHSDWIYTGSGIDYFFRNNLYWHNSKNAEYKILKILAALIQKVGSGIMQLS